MLEMDMTTNDSLHNLSDDQLVARVQTLAGDERRATVALIASLAALIARHGSAPGELVDPDMR